MNGLAVSLSISALAIVLLFVPARIVRAQSAPQVQLQADDTVGVGETLRLSLSATSAVTMPTDAQPGPTRGFIVRGQSAAPSQTHIFANGTQIDRYTLNVTWALEAQRVGTFRLGPASVVVAGATFRSQPVTITVMPAGQAPRRRASQQPQLPPGFQSPFGLSPFDMWKGLMPGFDDQTPPPQTPANDIDPKLSLDAPRGSVFFLHAAADKSAAVVGEQVTFSVYQYADMATHGEIDGEDAHDATAADFAKHALLREDQTPPLVGYAAVGGRTWEVRLLRRWALFPLHAGDLTIGPMRLNLLRPAGVGAPQRTSESLVVHATEPPLARRPPGYALGDVGHFTMTAQVSPREAIQGGAVAVHVELSGTGNLPSALTAPVREGVEWLAPEVKEELGPTGSDAFGGKRTFDFVVRMHRPGQLDLGEMSLPFWDPAQRRYEVARASLGRVEVAPAPGVTNPPPDESRDLLAGLPAGRDRLEGSPAARGHFDDSPVFWFAFVAAWPVAFVAAVAGRAVGRRALGAWQQQRQSPATALREKLTAAQAACRADDPRGADAAIVRALEAAALAHAGVSVRGALGGEVLERLEGAGIAHDAASHVASLLRECETARFSPDATDITAARDRWLRAQGAIRGLEKGP